MAQNKQSISTLNSLIETLKDGQEGFKQAADGVVDLQLKSLFNEYSRQRGRFAKGAGERIHGGGGAHRRPASPSRA